MESAVCEDLCVAVAGVPKAVSKEDLLKCVADRSDSSVVKWTTVDGAENDRNLERLLLKLDSKSGVTRLCEDIKHEEIEVDGESHTITFEKCIKCEIPLDWGELEMDGDPDPDLGNASQGHTNTNPEHQQAGQLGFQAFMHQFNQDGALPTFYQNTDNPAYSGQGQGHYQPFMNMSQGQRQGAPQGVPQGAPPQGVPQGVPQFPPNFNPIHFAPNFRFRYPFPMPQPGGQQQVDGQNMEQGSQPGPQPVFYDPRLYMPPPPYNSGGPDMCEPTYQIPQESATNVKQRVEEKGRIPSQAIADQDEYLKKLKEKGKEAEGTSSQHDSGVTEEFSHEENVYEQDKVEKTNKIVLKDLPDGAHSQFIELFFEKKKFGGYEVSNVEVDEELCMALVEFYDTEAVDKILELAPVEMLDREIRVKPFYDIEEEEPLCTVEVTGLDGSDYGTVEMYFENTKRAGGDDIADLNYYEDEGKAYITYHSEEVARRVVEKGNHVLNRKNLEVSLWQPPPKNKWNVRTPEPEPEEEPLQTIEILGIDDTIDESTLEMYFENTKRSGGDDIADMKVLGNVAYITYFSEEVAQRVVDKGPHTLNKRALEVSLWRPGTGKDRTIKREASLEPVCTVEVQGISHSIDEETLEMYFENEKRSGGGDIQGSQVDYDEGLAYITFKEEAVAQRVVDRGNHFINKKPLTVTLYCPSSETPLPREPEHEPQRTVEVQGIGPSIDKETLEMYFENEKRSGGGDIDQTDLDQNEGVALITYFSEEVAMRVVQKGNHFLNKKPLTVTIHMKQIEKPAPKKRGTVQKFEVQAESVESDEEEQKPTAVVKVKGVKRVKSLETMRYYFENHRRSDGGDITELSRHEEDEDVVFITFEEAEVAKRVANRQHSVENTELQVSLHIPPKPRPVYDDKILIRGLQTSTTKDCLFNFLEAKSGSVPIEWLRGEKEGVVLVTFDSQPDFRKLVEICNKTALEGGMLQVTQVQVTNCIIALNIPDNTTQDTVWYYFENTRRSNGGPIDKVIMREDEGSCLVYFMDYKVVDKVVAKAHQLGGQTLIVKIFLDCLGCPQGDSIEMPFKLPDSILISELDAKKIKFMRNSKVNQEAIATQMRDVHAEIKWPEVTQRDVIIECTLTKDMKDARKLAKSWKTTALTNFEDFMKNVVVETLSVVPEQWNPTMDNVKNLHIKNPDAVAVLADREQGHIAVAGLKQIVEGVAKDIAGIIKQVEDDAEKEKQKTKETMTSLPLIQTKMLLAEKFPNTMEKKFPELKVKINQSKNEIVFDGLQGDIRAAKYQMYEMKDKYATTSVDFTGCKSHFSLYDSKPAKDYIVKKLKNNHVTAVWEVKEQTLTVCSTGRDALTKSLELIKNSVVEHSVSLTRENRDLVQSENWVAMLDEQKQKYPGRTDVEVQGTVAFVCGTDDCVQDVLGAVKKFLKKNTIIEEHVNFSKPINRLIEKNHKTEIEEISKKSASLHAQVVTKSDNAGFTLRGTTEGVDHIKRELDNLRRRVQSKDHTLTNPGIASYMETKGRDHINTVESKHAVVIDDSPNEDDGLYEELPGLPAMDHGNLRIDSECTIYDDRKIYTAEGDMTELNVEVLVNTADTKLSLTGGLGKAIVSKGGNEVLDACKNYIRDEGELSEGEAFLSPAGKLRAKYIVHIVGPVWKDGTQNEEQLLAESVLKSMKQATVKNVRSIALPAISCGVYSFPIRRATKVIVQSVKNFFREIQDSTIMKVYLCDVKSATVENFTNALVQEFGDRNVRKMPKMVRPKTAPRKPTNRGVSMFTSPHSNDDSSGDEGPQTLPARRSQGGIQIGKISVTVVKGEIAKQSVDVIVNTTARNLDLKNGAVSASLLRTAGNRLQDEVTNKYPNGIKDGEIAVTSGQSLKCQTIIHTSLMNWDGGKSQEAKKALHTLMNNCLNEADTNNFRSIAFPAIGTGNLGFPKDVVAREMFNVIANFSKNYPNSSLRDVRFIVYQKDIATISAFDTEEKLWLSGDGPQRNRQSRQIDPPYANFREIDQSDSDDSDASGDYDQIDEGSREDDDDDDAQSEDDRLRPVMVKVERGDITKVSCDCIINSSNESLDLSKGAVSQALMKVGGEELRNECRAKARTMKADGIVMTKAPGLPFKSIIHVVAQDSTRSWRKMVDRCFQMAEAKRIRSIAFPALGTNIQANPTDIADVMVSALRDFESKPHENLQEVQFIIFQGHMVDIFRKAVEKTDKSKKGGLFSTMISGISAGLGYGEKRKSKKFKKSGKKTKVAKSGTPDQFPICVYSMSMEEIEKAIKHLETIIRNEVQKQEFKDPLLKNLQEAQRKQIKALEKEYNVQIRFQGSDRLEVIGLIQNVMDANNKIHSVIRQLDRMEIQKSEAVRVSRMVQWFFIDITEVKQELIQYDPAVNMLIENAFNEGKPKVAFSDKDGNKYIIEFDKMHEYPEGDPTDCVNVIRRDRMKDGSFETPKSWNTMGDENLKVVTLQNTDAEFQDIANKFTTSVNSSNFVVTRIDRIQNKTLWMQYQAKKKLLDTTNKTKDNEKLLWHGTTVDSVDSINANGFNRSYCGKNATAFGDGVYFAVNASYSCSDTYSRPDSSGVKRMYLCHVLTGEYTQGKSGMRVPPSKQGGATSSLYDSVANNVSNPTMFIIFHDTQAYPQYLILFKKKS